MKPAKIAPAAIASGQPGPSPTTPNSPIPPRSAGLFSPEISVPIIEDGELLLDVVRKLTDFIIHVIDVSYTFEQLRTGLAAQKLRPLVAYLADDCDHNLIVSALLISRWMLKSADTDDLQLSESRGLACEIVAWQFLTCLSERELIDYLLTEIPGLTKPRLHFDEESTLSGKHTTTEFNSSNFNEESPLLQEQDPPSSQQRNARRTGQRSPDLERLDCDIQEYGYAEDPTKPFAGLNALEVAAVAGAKKFISQGIVQKIVQGIWNGDVVFWDPLAAHAKKKAHVYNKRVADPYSRLRVPKYQKIFQSAFFGAFLALYYFMLYNRDPHRITAVEVLLYVWLISFAYDELSEFTDAGFMFYSNDFWSLWDLGIIGTGIAFIIARAIGLTKGSDYIINIAFDILSLEALFLVPRICSLMSLNSYFGSLIPVLKEMTKAFIKFLPIVLVLYLGFLTTFTMLARDKITLTEMSWILIKVFFGSSYLGFDVAADISDIFGTPLMLIFVTLTQIVLITSLISLLSNSLTEVMAHAREEYLFQYTIYVLESSTSQRLTYFMPPLNLIPLLLIRPMRLFFPHQTVRKLRIAVLKATHFPFVMFILAYERGRRLAAHQGHSPPSTSLPISPTTKLGRNVLLRKTRSAPTNESPLANNIPVAESTPHLFDRQVAFSAQNAPTNTAENVAELTVLVRKLTAQVDQLSSAVISHPAGD